MNRALLAFAAVASLLASTSAGAAIVFDFSTHPGNVGTSETYADSGAPGTPLTVTAKGYDGAGVATALFGKNAGGDENGLGLTNDPTGDNEIALGKGFVQLDIGSFLPFASSLNTVAFFMNSTTEGETWNVFGSNADGAVPVGLGLISGSDELPHLLPNFGTYRYYDFYETSSSGGKNVLLSKLTANVVGTPFDTPPPVPEPATWAMMLLGFCGIGATMRRKTRGAKLLQLA
jgi:PEP-CTERM motif